MTALEEIKKALESVGPLKVEFTPDCDEFNAIIAPINDDYDGTFFTVIGCGDKQDKLGGFMAVAVNAVPELLSTLESLQRENEELRHRLKAPEPDLTCPHIDKLVETGELSIEAIHELYHIRDINSMLRYGLWHEKSRAEAAEAEVKRLITVVQTAHVAMTLAFHMPGVAEEYDFSDAIAATFHALASTGGEHHAE